MTNTQPLTTDLAFEIGYERGMQGERDTIAEYLELRVRLITRMGLRNSRNENICIELERLAQDIREGNHYG